MNFRLATIDDMLGIAKVGVDTWRTTYHSILPADLLRNLSYEEKEIKNRRRFEDPNIKRFIYIAENDSKKIIGFSMGSLEIWNYTSTIPEIKSYIGELMAVYVLQEYQRNHIGLELVKLIVKYLFENNIRRMIVWVLKGNPHYKFYEILGGKYLGQKLLEIEGKNYVEHAYGWQDITKILEI